MTLQTHKDWLAAVVTIFFIGGCASSAETKMASTQYKTALDAYSQNVRAFERAWIGEIGLLIDDLHKSIAARAVTERVRVLSAESDGFSSTDWEQEVARNGLISLSEAVDIERERVRNVIKRIGAIKRPQDQDPTAVVNHVLGVYRQESIAAINEISLLPDGERNRLLAEAEAGPFGNDVVANSMIETIIIWEMARDAIPRDLDHLESVIAALKTAHASVDQWIQTDVTVPGEEVATLVGAWSSALGGEQ